VLRTAPRDIRILSVAVEKLFPRTLPARHVTLFIGAGTHVSPEIIGLCERADKWSTAYGASRTTEARFRSSSISLSSAPFSPATPAVLLMHYAESTHPSDIVNENLSQ